MSDEPNTATNLRFFWANLIWSAPIATFCLYIITEATKPLPGLFSLAALVTIIVAVLCAGWLVVALVYRLLKISDEAAHARWDR